MCSHTHLLKIPRIKPTHTACKTTILHNQHLRAVVTWTPTQHFSLYTVTEGKNVCLLLQPDQHIQERVFHSELRLADNTQATALHNNHVRAVVTWTQKLHFSPCWVTKIMSLKNHG